jgi:hypothetical protein
MNRTFLTLASVALFAAPGAATAQRDGRAVYATDGTSNFVGGDFVYAQPQGEFGKYVNGAFGVAGHFIHAFDPNGVIAFRAELGYLIYGERTARQPLGGGALGLINVDVTTSNSILIGGAGLQLMAPTGVVRPYLAGTLGFSYFVTSSSVAGSDYGSSPFAESQNFSDGGFTTAWGGGLYIPLSFGSRAVSLDLGVQQHKTGDVQYLTANSITFNGSNAPPTIQPVRSAADYLTYRLGVSVALR